MKISHYFYFDIRNKKILTFNREVAFDNLVRMSVEQEAYYLAHKKASYDMIWYCGNIPIPPQPERTLEDAIREKLDTIDAYDTSENVNGFYLNANLVWLDRDTRASLKNTIESSILMGRETLNIWFGDVYVTLPIETAKLLLATLELYATDCYNVTAQHKTEVKQLSTIEEVDDYDVEVGYPEKLSFTL